VFFGICAMMLAPSAVHAQAEASSAYPRVCCRPLRKFAHSRLPAARLLGLAAGGFDHCFIETRPGFTTGIHPIEPHVANKQPVPNEETDSIAWGGECKKIEDATPEKMQRLQKEIDARICYSCGADYHNSAATGYFNNSNTYVFDLVKSAGMTPPAFPHAPGYKARSRPSDALDRVNRQPERGARAAAEITPGFPGAAKLAGFSRSQDASLLLYVRNVNHLALLHQGSMASLRLKTRLSAPGGCCDHRALPSLSHRGGRLAYVRLASSSPHRETVTIREPGTGSQQEVFDAPVVWAVSWSPDDRRLAIVAQPGGAAAFAAESDLYIVDLSSKQVTQITHGSLTLQGLRYSVSTHAAASWDPAGGRLAVELRRSGEETASAPAAAIALFDLASGAVTWLAGGAEPAWSPAQDLIAFMDEAGAACFTMRPDGSDKKTLFSAQGGFFSTGPAAPIFFPAAWSPKGDQLLFHQWADEGRVFDVYRFDMATAKAKLIGRGELQVVDWR